MQLHGIVPEHSSLQFNFWLFCVTQICIGLLYQTVSSTFGSRRDLTRVIIDARPLIKSSWIVISIRHRLVHFAFSIAFLAGPVGPFAV